MIDSRRLSIYRSVPVTVALLANLALPVSAFAAVCAGAGILVTPDGYFLTCSHVIDGAPLVAHDGRKQFAGISELALIVEKAIAAVSVDTTRLIEEEQAKEREQAERLRRAREEHEARRTEAARKLEAEQVRQKEIDRLRTTVMNLEQRESSLHHEVMSIQQQLGSVSRDPADHSAMARRSELERQLNYFQNQLNQTTTSKQGAMQHLNQQQVR